ncbi:MAG: type I glutamate--ammonia ligase [Candidatus Gracilibacteria bacterium]
MTPTATIQQQMASAQNAVRATPREHMYSRYPRTSVTKLMIMEMVEEYGVRFVDMQFTDMNGVLKVVTVPVHKLEDGIDNNVWFDGSSIGFMSISESDMVLKPDLDTFAVLPWTLGAKDVTARLICDVLNPDGTPFEGDPRFILRRQVEEAKKLGFESFMGPELEFFLFKTDAEGKPTLTPHDNAGYFDQNTDEGLALRREMAFALDIMGVEVERMHHEVAAGQHEINSKYANALRAADDAISFKLTLKTVAKRHGLHATFMPKPMFGVNGSGMHVHQSLFSLSEGVNKFYDETGTYGISTLAQSYIAGQLVHIRAMNAVMNPTVNSYKRLVVGYEAPVNVAWGQRNRSALIRIPRISPAVAAKGARIELRCPDPSANPYLAFAVMLAAGLDGIKKGLAAPAPVEENIWKLSPEQMKKLGIRTVAGNLKEAIDELEKDEVIRGVLGEETFQKFYTAKLNEWESFRTSVSKWETDKYMGC